MNILEEAHKVTSVDRKDQYGSCEDSFKLIGEYWSTYLHHEVNSKDVALMMSLLKVARETHQHKKDNLVDACGYLRLASKISGDEKESSLWVLPEGKEVPEPLSITEVGGLGSNLPSEKIKLFGYNTDEASKCFKDDSYLDEMRDEQAMSVEMKDRLETMKALDDMVEKQYYAGFGASCGC